MDHILSKVIVLAGSIGLLFYTYDIGIKTTALMLVGLIIGLLGGLLRNPNDRGTQFWGAFSSRYFSRVCAVLYSMFFLAGMFYAPAVAMAPFVVYDAVRHGLRWPSMLFLIPSEVWCMLQGEGMPVAYSVILALFAAELAAANVRNESLEEERLRQRDASVEHDLLVDQRNRELMEKQDASIYMATLQERNRIAREIHDNVGHMLTRSILQVGAIKVINQSEELKEPLENLQETLNAAMTSMRNSVHDLHDESVDLKSSIEKLTAELENFQVQLDYDMGQAIPRDVKYAFIAITKEAVNNAVKYSNGDSVSVILREHPGFYQLLIADNGTGARIREQGIGLQNMKERVDALGGTIKITTENGFRILISIMKGNNHEHCNCG